MTLLVRGGQRAGSGRAAVRDDPQEISRGIHPAVLAQGGLTPALKSLARRSAVPVKLNVRTAMRLPEPVEVAVYYVVSEALDRAAIARMLNSAARPSAISSRSANDKY